MVASVESPDLETDDESSSISPRWPRAAAFLGVLGLLCLGLLLPKEKGLKVSLQLPAGIDFEEKSTSSLSKSAEKEMQDAAVKAINEVFAKIVVPKANSDTIPQTVQRQHDDPMATVVDSSKMKLTDLTGLNDFKITSLTASSVEGSSSASVGTGFSGTATAKMEMEGAIAETMTANAILYKDGQVSYQGTLSIDNFKMKMSMTGTMQSSTGASLNPSNMMENMKHMTIESIKNGAPSFSMKCKISCGRRLKKDDSDNMMTDMAKDSADDVAKDTHASCHAAQMAIDVGQPAFDLAMGLKFQSIFQKSFNKQFPMTLGDKTKTAGTVHGNANMELNKVRRLSAVSDFAADADSTMAVVKTLADMTNVPPESVHVQLVPDEANDQIQMEYAVSVNPGSGVDIYDVRDTLNRSEEDMGKHISESVQAMSGTSQKISISNHDTQVLSPMLYVTGSWDVPGAWSVSNFWETWVFWISIALALIALLALTCLDPCQLCATRPRKKRDVKMTEQMKQSPTPPETTVTPTPNYQPVTSQFPVPLTPAPMLQMPGLWPGQVAPAYLQPAMHVQPQQFAYSALPASQSGSVLYSGTSPQRPDLLGPFLG